MILPWPILRLLNNISGGPALSVLIFHRVLAAADPLFPGEPDARRFDEILSWVRSWFTVLPLDAAVRRLQDGNLGADALSITFDDGYADNFHVALPLLKKHGLNATFFVATGFLDGGRMWNDTVIESIRRSPHDRIDLRDSGLDVYPLGDLHARRTAITAILDATKYLPLDRRQDRVEALARASGSALPRDLMMTSSEVRSLYNEQMRIGAHTRTHPILARLDDAAARSEIAEGRSELERIIDAPVDLFAYPNGKPGTDYGARDVAIVKALGFKAAVSTAWGCARAGEDLYQIPRFTPWDRTRMRFGIRLMSNRLRRNAYCS